MDKASFVVKFGAVYEHSPWVAEVVYDDTGAALRIEMIVELEPLTRSAFEPFGEVLEIAGLKPEIISQGNTQKFADLARVTSGAGDRVQVSIYRSRVVSLPFRICQLERRSVHSQAFYPLHDHAFPVIVALGDTRPDTLRAFLSNGQQGVNLHPGIWHYYQVILEQESDYIVIDSVGTGELCEEHRLEKEVLLTDRRKKWAK